MPNYKHNLTPEEVVFQLNRAVDKLNTNKENFVINVMKAAQKSFKHNFATKQFEEDTGEVLRWARLRPFTSKRRINVYHTDPADILVDTGILRRSIEIMGNGSKSKVSINTTRFMTNWHPLDSTRIRRQIAHQKKTRKHENFCYAGIHNDPPNDYYFGTHTKLVQRKFMGHSAEMKAKIFKLGEEILLKDMP